MALILNWIAESFLQKDKKRSVYLKYLRSQKFTKVFDKYTEFLEKYSQASEMFLYLQGIVKLCKLMKKLMVAERTDDWRGHLQSVQELLPVFRECDSLNYLRCGSWYLQKIWTLETEYQVFTKNLRKITLRWMFYCDFTTELTHPRKTMKTLSCRDLLGNVSKQFSQTVQKVTNSIS